MVRDFLAAHNMKVMSMEPNNHFMVAQGSVGECADGVQHADQPRHGEGKDAPCSLRLQLPLRGRAAGLVSTVQGLSDLAYRTNARLSADPDTESALMRRFPLSAAGPDGLFFNANCLRPPETQTFTTNGSFPKATYTGNRYGADITSPAS